MSLDLFRLQDGIGIELDTGQEANILIGDGAPGGDGASGPQNLAPVGSVYQRTDAETDGLQYYWKFTTANGTSADWKQATDKQYVDAIASGLSWREPALVLDDTTYADITAAETAANVADTVDGVGIAVDDRLLFTDLTTGNENVYIVSGSTGAWTFTEDPLNTATDGDAILIQDGTASEQQWVYDGATWVQFGGATSAAELGYIRAFIGKSGPGSETPTYTSEDVVTSGDNLEVAIGKLDNVMGDGVIANQGGNWALSDDMTWNGASNDGTLEVTDALEELNTAIGDRSYTNDNVVTDGQSVAASIDALDAALGDSLVIHETGITTIINVDTLPLAGTDVAKWILTAEQVGTPANRYSTEIHALTDGTSVDYNKFSTLKLGSKINGLTIGVAISGTDMVLQVTSTSAVDVSVKRLAANLIN